MRKNKMRDILKFFYVGTITFFMYLNNVFADDTLIDCEGETMKFINDAFNIIKICIPVLLIALGMVDFVKAMIASDEQKMKKAQKDFVTRLILGVVVFFVPSILTFLLSLIGIESCAVS